MYQALEEIESLIKKEYNNIQGAPHEVRVLLDRISFIAKEAIEELDRRTREDVLLDEYIDVDS